MIKEFWSDLSKAKYSEQLVREVLSSLTDEYEFQDVSNQREYFYKGDIRAVSKTNGSFFMLEVKDDSRIAETRNVLCEEEVYYKESNYFGKGNMQSDYDIYCVVSQAEQKIYIIDFSILKKIYKQGEFKIIKHFAQDTYCYLLPLGVIKKNGGLIKVIEY